MGAVRGRVGGVVRSVWALSLALLIVLAGGAVPERAWTVGDPALTAPMTGIIRIAATNAHGQKAGVLQAATGLRQAARWEPDGKITVLGTLGGAESWASALNDVGDVVGAAQTASGVERAFRWTSATGLRDLGTLGGMNSRALAINAAGHVAGEAQTADGAWRAFGWEPTGLRDLGTLGGRHSRAWDLSDRNQVVGEAQTATAAPHAFLWQRAEGLRDLGTLGGSASRARTITADGRILGEAQDATGAWHPVVWAERDPADASRRWLPLNTASSSSLSSAPSRSLGFTRRLTAASAASAAFVAHLYTQFYGREGDAGGVDYWGGQIDGCALTPAQVVRVFFEAPEFADVVGPTARLYFAALGRIPDGPGLDYWVRKHRAGDTLGAIAVAFVESAEFVSRYGTGLNAAQFVNIMYQNVLGRPADPEGEAFWINEMAKGATPG